MSRKSDTAGAIGYVLSHWRALTRNVDDGLLEIDNSAAERALRAVSIGRKNYLFFGADSGEERAASFYTLIGTAKLNGLDPSFYLRTVLARIADHPINRIGELLPWNIAATLPSDPAEVVYDTNRRSPKISGHLLGSSAPVKRGAPYAYGETSIDSRSSGGKGALFATRDADIFCESLEMGLRPDGRTGRFGLRTDGVSQFKGKQANSLLEVSDYLRRPAFSSPG